jgi:hypothetical protein
MPEQMDPEVQAILTLLAVLEPLPLESRNNVIDYVFKRLGIKMPNRASHTADEFPDRSVAETVALRPLEAMKPVGGHQVDIRSFTKEKKPQSVNQMVAVVAYYLAHLAPDSDRRDHIQPNDIKKYFSGNYPLPTSPPSQTLQNAKNAGYLDPLASGQYRLNPVGHNLVVHKLPADASTTEGSVRGRSRQKRKKPTGRKKR